ncbi:hypothetical protein CEXT_189971 [Caerostris extrusa]|uniref:Uncharacterized protein n=1 Tax=Caerostris extrusa TaxID=172846 RepID=A0AAV4NF45_CAEEX|nr:hypothetical protein CEXT_189971 [Caerostris extrusa]
MLAHKNDDLPECGRTRRTIHQNVDAQEGRSTRMWTHKNGGHQNVDAQERPSTIIGGKFRDHQNVDAQEGRSIRMWTHKKDDPPECGRTRRTIHQNVDAQERPSTIMLTHKSDHLP